MTTQSNTQPSIFDPEDAARINFSQQIRETAIKQLFKDGFIPEATSDRVTLIQLLDGMDRTTLAKTKIKAEDSAAKNNNAVQTMIADALKKVSRNPNGNVIRTLPTELDESLDVSTLVSNETFIGIEQLDYETFMRNTKPVGEEE